MSAIKISILIPVYNVADYVAACLDSILTQIDHHTEIIVMNDASTDHSWAVLQSYPSHPSVTLLQAPHNRGLSGTRNALLTYAKGEYIWFIDSDDVMHTDAYTKVMEQLTLNPVDVLCADYIAWSHQHKRYKKAFVGKDGVVFQNTQHGFIQNIVKNNSNHVWNKIYKKSIIEKIEFKVGLKFEDIYYMTDLDRVCQSYMYLKYPVIDYREREGSIVKTLDQKYVDDYLGAFLYRLKMYNEFNDVSQRSKAYLNFKVYMRFARLVKNVSAQGNKALLDYTKQNYSTVFQTIKHQHMNELDWFNSKKIFYYARKIDKIFNITP